MVTLGLVSVTLALSASLMRMYGRGARLISSRNQGFQALEAVLYQVRSEAMGAVDFQTPASTSASFQPGLEFQRVYRQAPNRLTDFEPGWTPYGTQGGSASSDFLVSIRYVVRNEGLDRDVRLPGGSFSTSTLLPQGIQALRSRLNNDGTMDLQIEVKGQVKTRTYENRFLRRVQPL